MPEIGLGLGGNLGDPAAAIRKALALMEARGIARIDKVSSLYRTAPWGGVPQPDYANACALGQTELAPFDLLDAIKALEPATSTVAAIGMADFDAVAELANVVAMAEAGAVHFDWLRDRPDDYGPQVGMRLAQALAMPAPIYIRALQIRAVMLRQVLDSVFVDCDVLVVPAMPFLPPMAADVDVGAGAKMNSVVSDMTRFTRLFSYLGLPVVTLPAARSRDGLPVGVQIVAAPWREDLAASVAAHLEQVLALGPFLATQSTRSAA
mgnify:CR=1 FL=1